MNHKLDNHPISERMIYVNDLQLANDVPYETAGDEGDPALQIESR